MNRYIILALIIIAGFSTYFFTVQHRAIEAQAEQLAQLTLALDVASSIFIQSGLVEIDEAGQASINPVVRVKDVQVSE